MWTRLMWIDLPNALKSQKVNGKWHSPILSGRYRHLLRRQFKVAGVPWIYENKVQKKNPRHKKPKGKIWMLEKPIRLAKIKKALEEAD
mmetsp:Transcript_10147/g.8681  ORF Transcript_10147/g.8681 Transcript_10147/m.8681 type:complete len:88 (-) Transcript_10147:286-549(-)